MIDIAHITEQLNAETGCICVANKYVVDLLNEVIRLSAREAHLSYALSEFGHWCDGCKNPIDPDICHCGSYIKDHMFAEHYAVPMGCDCYRSKATSDLPKDF